MDEAVHVQWMHRCLELALRGAGHVSPNPLVGAVLVDGEGDVLGEGWHGRYGGPHAEVWAIRDALRRHPAEVLHAATLYVNLEPCSHHGKTPPCADAIVERGIPRVVVAMADPHPKVAGRGFQRLEQAGVAVDKGVLEREAFRLNEAFVHHVRTGRPLVTLKVAQTLDGQVATITGDSRWISGEPARTLVHRWRTQMDAVMVGRGTAAADDPALTVRHVSGRQPVRVVLDASGTLPAKRQLFEDAYADRTLVAVAPGMRPSYADALEARGGRVLEVARAADGRLDLRALLQRLGSDGGMDRRPLQSIMVEAGRSLATSLFAEDLVDRYAAFIAPKLVGAGISVIGDLGIAKMKDAFRFEECRWEEVGEDLLFTGYRHPAEAAASRP